jgi:hypothetical protein
MKKYITQLMQQAIKEHRKGWISEDDQKATGVKRGKGKDSLKHPKNLFQSRKDLD